MRFNQCSFRSALLHYSNLRGSHFNDCDLARSVLVGAYLEGATVDRNCRQVDMLTSHIDARNADWANRPPIDDDVVSLLWEEEYDWSGQWRSVVPDVFVGRWVSQSGGEVQADITAVSESQFHRSSSSDHNDGNYYLTTQLALDAARDVYLVGGRWAPSTGVHTAWSAVWWRQWEKRETHPFLSRYGESARRTRGLEETAPG